MNTYYYSLIFLLQFSIKLKADVQVNKEKSDVNQDNCTIILNDFANYSSELTKCAIMFAKPIKLCENCIDQYMNFHEKYQELVTTIINGTSCKSKFISQDRLNAVQEYHDNILSIWDKGHCNACYDWTNNVPVRSNATLQFNILYKETDACIQKYMKESNNKVCEKCMQEYVLLDNFYKTLSSDGVGVESVCMDIFDSMNATRSTWSKTLHCCKIRKTPEIIFLCCAGIISSLPLLYYVLIRYCGPIRDFPNVLKQSRFKQTIIRSLKRRTN